jgi:hypothetical protein
MTDDATPDAGGGTGCPQPGATSDIEFDRLWACGMGDAQPPTVSPRPACVWDALLNGNHHRMVDRAVANRMLAAHPGMRDWAGAHAHFRSTAIKSLKPTQIRQWLDLGCGLPTGYAAYGILMPGAPRDSRVVCVDNDPFVVQFIQDLLPLPEGDRPVVAPLLGDLRDPLKVLNTITDHGLIDFAEPVAVLLSAVLQHLSDSDASELLHTIRDFVTSGSYLLLSHPSIPEPGNTDLADAIEHYQATTATWTLRGIDQAPALLGGHWTAQPPGITPVGLWHPDIAAPDDLDDDPDFVQAQADIAGWAVIAAATPTAPRHGGDR